MNSQYFSEEQVKAGEMDAFLKALRAQDYGKGGYYNDVHIKPVDCGAYSVDWSQLRWEDDEDKGFEYIDSEHVIMLERDFPDNTSGYFMDEQDYNDQLEEWLENQKEAGLIWKKNQYGRWYEEGEQKAWEKMLEKHSEKSNECPKDDVPEEFA